MDVENQAEFPLVTLEDQTAEYFDGTARGRLAKGTPPREEEAKGLHLISEAIHSPDRLTDGQEVKMDFIEEGQHHAASV